jgi:protein TonB
MRASNTYPSNGSKVTKIAIVTLLHVGVALALIGMKVVVKDGPKKDPVVVTFKDPVVVEHEKIKVDLKAAPLALPVVPVVKTIIDLIQPETPIAKVAPPGTVIKDAGGIDKGTGTDKVTVVAEVKKEKVYMAALANAGDCVRPDYPARAARNGDTGTVSLALLIGVDGKVTDAKIKQTSGFKELDRAAISALSMCKFKPATTNGVAEPAWGQIAYVWSLD